MENITTNKIIDSLYNDQLEKKIHKKEMQAVIAAFILAIREELKQGNKVSVAGLGTFTVKAKPEAVKHLPSGARVTVPAHTVAKFSASKYLADKVYHTKVEG